MLSRRSFSLSRAVKAMTSPATRVRLCRILEPHFLDGLNRSDDDPTAVTIGEDTYTLCASRNTPGKVYVSVR